MNACIISSQTLQIVRLCAPHDLNLISLNLHVLHSTTSLQISVVAFCIIMSLNQKAIKICAVACILFSLFLLLNYFRYASIWHVHPGRKCTTVIWNFLPQILINAVILYTPEFSLQAGYAVNKMYRNACCAVVHVCMRIWLWWWSCCISPCFCENNL